MQALGNKLFNHGFVRSNNKCGVVHEEKQTDCLQSRDCGLGQTTVEIVHENHERDFQFTKGCFECVS